jgi:isopenicillin N synthase-like dioxygenase
MTKHLDHNRITILVQDGVSGLEVFKDRVLNRRRKLL